MEEKRKSFNSSGLRELLEMKQNRILFIKSIIYRPYSELVTFFVAWIITGQLKLSLFIGLADFIVKIFSYFIFDVLWKKFVVDKYNPCVIWLTGLSGSGKTTISNAISDNLKQKGKKIILLDGDEIRNFFKTGFDKQSRIEHNINVGKMASLFESQGFIVIVSLISPYAEARNKCRDMAKSFMEIYINTPLEVCEKRDVKGLYAKARSGEIKQFTGIDDVYEEPTHPFATINTNEKNIDECVEIILQSIQYTN